MASTSFVGGVHTSCTQRISRRGRFNIVYFSRFFGAGVYKENRRLVYSCQCAKLNQLSEGSTSFIDITPSARIIDMTKKLDTEPYKGVRDFYPEDMFVEKYVFDTSRRIVESYGYSEYNASILEPSELYRAKTGDEIVNEQTYTFVDRGDREVTLRPEMTPSLARMVARKKRELSFPLRWYSIPNLFRYERPQRGRLREHWQLNVDVFGIEGIEADVEIISIAYKIMITLGFRENDFEIRINDRILIDQTLASAELDEQKQKEMRKLIDRKDKIQNFEEEVKKIAGDSFSYEPKENERILSLLSMLNNSGIKNVVFSPTLVRGFDYYTGIVFEVFDTHPDNNRSIFGGGRYDNLLDIFGGDTIPAVGFGMGDVTMRDALETHNLIPAFKSKSDLYVCSIDEKGSAHAEGLAKKLREKGLNIAIDYTKHKVGKQIQKAEKDGIPYVVCVGEHEAETHQYKIKHLETGEEKELPEDGLVDFLLETRK